MDKNCGTCKLSTLCIGEDIEEVVLDLQSCFVCGNVYVLEEFTVPPSWVPEVLKETLKAKKPKDKPRTNQRNLCEEMQQALFMEHIKAISPWVCDICSGVKSKEEIKKEVAKVLRGLDDRTTGAKNYD